MHVCSDCSDWLLLIHMTISSRRIAERASIIVEARSIEQSSCDTSNEASVGTSLALNNYMKSISAIEKNVVRSSAEMEAMSSLDVTKRHHSRSNNLENSLTKAIGSVINKDSNKGGRAKIK